MKYKLPSHFKPYNSYQIVDDTGNVIETFRLKATANIVCEKMNNQEVKHQLEKRFKVEMVESVALHEQSGYTEELIDFEREVGENERKRGK